jgi:hypothetical protein
MTYNSLSSLVWRVMAAAITLAAPSIAAAQDSSPSAAGQGGPMAVEQVSGHYAIAPEVKASKFDGKTGVFAGGHGGVLIGNSLLVGGGLYTLTNGSRGRGMTYGGGVVGWQWWNGGFIGGNIRGLVGVGQGTTTENLTFTDREGRTFREGRFLSSDFFVAEPQADLVVRLTKHLHLDFGAGYRLTSAPRGESDRFRGASGSLALRIGSAVN